MKNLKKTVAAGVLGLAIIAGTAAGTFATWQNEASIDGGLITTGHLGVTLGWSTSWYVQNADGTKIPLGENDLGVHPLIPGQSAYRNLKITPELVGLEINDVKLSTEWGNLNLDTDGYLLNDQDQRSNLRFSIITKDDPSDWMFLNPELRVTFVRDAEFVGMYDNNLSNLDLGSITVTITQK